MDDFAAWNESDLPKYGLIYQLQDSNVYIVDVESSIHSNLLSFLQCQIMDSLKILFRTEYHKTEQVICLFYSAWTKALITPSVYVSPDFSICISECFYSESADKFKVYAKFHK